MVLSMGVKMCATVLLGASPLAVLVSETALNLTAMFNHANIRMPLALDRVLRWLVVTPDMHRVHHSVDHVEHNTNFGFNLSCWDRLMGTYRDQPAKGHQEMIIGLESFRDRTWQTLPRILAMPFFKPAASGIRGDSGEGPGE